MIAEQTKQRKRQSHRPPPGIYHAPADMTAMQHNIAAVTLDRLHQGKAVDWRNLALTYKDAFAIVYNALSETERDEHGITCPEAELRKRLVARERQR